MEYNEIPVLTSTMSGRFEFIQSTITRQCSFLLDKVLGRVWLLIEDEDGHKSFKELTIYDKSEESQTDQISFQLYCSSITVADCLLLNIHTGEIWNLFKNEESDELYFDKIEY